MSEQTPDPVERLAHVVRHFEMRLPDTRRARGAQALVERLRKEEAGLSATPVASASAGRLRLRRSLCWSMGLAAAAAVLLLAFALRSPLPVSHSSGQAESRRPQRVAPAPKVSPDQAVLTILRPMDAPAGSSGLGRLEAQPGEEIRAWLADCGRVVLRESALLVVERSDPSGIRLRLHRGTLLVSFHHNEGRGLAVQTRDALVRVTGTVFAVAAGESPTRVSVSRGSVEVSAGGLPVSVTAGKSWQVGAASLDTPGPKTALALRELRALDPPHAVGRAGRPGRTVATPGERDEDEAPQEDEAPPMAPPPLPLPSGTVEDAESVYREAERALALGRTQIAKGLLESLVSRHPRDPLVMPATYELGRLSFAARDYARARDQLRRVRDSGRAAAAPFREPAAFLLCRSELDSGERQAALLCLERFRTSFPDSPHTGDALALLATLRLAEKDCGRARSLVEEYLRRFTRGAHAARLSEAMRRCR